MFNNLYGKRMDKKNRYAVYIYVLTESVDCALRIMKLQIDYNIALA